jgi:hypothetical protein
VTCTLDDGDFTCEEVDLEFIVAFSGTFDDDYGTGTVTAEVDLGGCVATSELDGQLYLD